MAEIVPSEAVALAAKAFDARFGAAFPLRATQRNVLDAAIVEALEAAYPIIYRAALRVAAERMAAAMVHATVNAE